MRTFVIESDGLAQEAHSHQSRRDKGEVFLVSSQELLSLKHATGNNNIDTGNNEGRVPFCSMVCESLRAGCWMTLDGKSMNMDRVLKDNSSA